MPDDGVRPGGRACGCHGDGDCAASAWGPKCLPLTVGSQPPYTLCGCTSDAQCSSGNKCIGFPGSCQPSP